MAAMIAATVGFVLGTLLAINSLGDFGMQIRSTSDGVVVDGVTPGGAGDRAGLHVGDVLHIEKTFAARIFWIVPRAGETGIAYVGLQRRPVTVTALPSSLPVKLAIVSGITTIAFLFMGALIAWRKPEDDAGRALATFLLCFALGMNVDGALFQSLTARFICFIAAESLFYIGIVAMALFSCRFPTRAESGFRGFLARIAIPAALIGIGLSIARLSLLFIAGNSGVQRLFLIPYILLYAFIIVASLISFAISMRHAEGAQRVQMRWVIITFATGFSGLIVYFALVLFGVNQAIAQYPTLTITVIPIGLGYMILRHRVLDITFVINRAVVYGAVSLIMVTSFIVFEWVIGNLVQQGTGASLALNVVAAIVLGFSVRFIHDRVDKRIDDIFFRDRHLAEAAIRRFGHESALITQTDDLMKKTVDVAQRNAKLEGAAFYSAGESAFVPRYSTFEATANASENDYAVLDMRTWHRPIDLTEYDTTITGEYAFPMIVRGQLAGFLACGPKTSHEALAPDERDALATLARDCGIALDSLRVHAIERELAEARAALAALVAAPKPQL